MTVARLPYSPESIFLYIMKRMKNYLNLIGLAVSPKEI